MKKKKKVRAKFFSIFLFLVTVDLRIANDLLVLAEDEVHVERDVGRGLVAHEVDDEVLGRGLGHAADDYDVPELELRVEGAAKFHHCDASDAKRLNVRTSVWRASAP